MKCCVCGTELRFLEYGSKVGKDGKPAKWPIYEKCPNKANHHQHARETAPAPVPQGRPERVPAPVIEVPDGIRVCNELKTGLAFTWDVKEVVDSYEVSEAVKKYVRRFGGPPNTARCNLRHYARIERAIAEAGLHIELFADLTFRPEWPRLDLDL